MIETPVEFIRRLETSYPVETLQWRGIHIWPFLRIHYCWAHEKKLFASDQSLATSSGPEVKDFARISHWKRRFLALKNAFWGCRALFGTYDSILSTYTLEDRWIHGKRYDKVAYELCQNKKSNLLILLDPDDFPHYPKAEYGHSQTASAVFFTSIAKFLRHMSRLLWFQSSPPSFELLDQIHKQERLSVDYPYLVTLFYSLVHCFNFFLSWKNIKAVYLNCYYSLFHQALTYCAHLHGVKVVEWQHALLDQQHYAYQLFKPFEKATYPDYFWGFGEFFTQRISEAFLDKTKITSVGSYFIENRRTHPGHAMDLKNRIASYRNGKRNVVAISSQITINDELFSFICKTAILAPQTLFLFLPRTPNQPMSPMPIPKNVKILLNENIYDAILISDVHATVYSTCGIEAYGLAKPTVFINIRGLTRLYYQEALDFLQTLGYEVPVVHLPEELAHQLNHGTISLPTLEFMDHFFKSNHRANLLEAIQRFEGQL